MPNIKTRGKWPNCWPKIDYTIKQFENDRKISTAPAFDKFEKRANDKTSKGSRNKNI